MKGAPVQGPLTALSFPATRAREGRGGGNPAFSPPSQTSVVNYNDQRPAAERSAQLFFVVFEWKDPFIQKVQDVSITSGRKSGFPARGCSDSSLQAVLVSFRSTDSFVIYDIRVLCCVSVAVTSQLAL